MTSLLRLAGRSTSSFKLCPTAYFFLYTFTGDTIKSSPVQSTSIQGYFIRKLTSQLTKGRRQGIMNDGPLNKRLKMTQGKVDASSLYLRQANVQTGAYPP